MLHSDVLVKKMSRRVALLSIAGTAGLVVAGCGSTVAGASGNDTSVAASTPTATTAAATPTPAPSPASTPTSVSTAEPGTTLFTYKGHTSTVETVTWSPDSQMVASIEQTGSLHVWEATTGKLKFVCHAIPGNKALSWSMNGKYIAAATGAGVSVWDASNGSLITNYNVGAITLAFSPDSERIATSSSDKTVQIWQTTTGAHLLTYNGHNTANGVPVHSLSWSPDSKQIVSASNSLGGFIPNMMASVKVWDTTTGSDILVYSTTHESNAVAWSPDGSRIASEEYVNGVETIQIWAAENGRGLALNQAKDDDVLKISWSPNSKYVALALGSYQSLMPGSRIAVHSAGGDSYQLDYKGHQPNVLDVAWSPDGSRIAYCSNDQTVQIWQAPS